jgi:excisionase family DNA binding protein
MTTNLGPSIAQTARAHGQTVGPAPKRFYSVKEAAGLLGVSPGTLYREIREGRFPKVKVRGRYVIPASALDVLEHAAIAAVAAPDVDWPNPTMAR